MREIKFRAWDKKARKMLYPGQAIPKRTRYVGAVWLEICAPYLNHSYEFGETPDEPDNFILLQYTGIKDKNNKEIYEGDICEGDPYGEGTVRLVMMWNDNKYGPGWEWVHMWSLAKGFHEWENLADYPAEEIEIIGNIYEHPELLKENE